MIEIREIRVSSNYPQLALIVATDSKRIAEYEAVLAYLEDIGTWPIVCWVGVWQDGSPFNVARVWNAVASQVGSTIIAFTATTVYPTESVIRKTLEVIQKDPKAVVIAHRLDVRQDGTIRLNHLACGDWLAMNRNEWENGHKWRENVSTGHSAHYAEFDYLARLYIDGRPIYVLPDQVIHGYHATAYDSDPEGAKQLQEANVAASVATGLPRIWWNWPADPWLEYPDHSEAMKIIRL